MASMDSAVEVKEILYTIRTGQYAKAMGMIDGLSDSALLLALFAIAHELERANEIAEGR